MDALFGKKPQGPSAGEKAMQQDRLIEANKADAEGSQKAALASRAVSLRKSLAYNDREKRGVTGA
jgi:hypothetical protein